MGIRLAILAALSALLIAGGCTSSDETPEGPSPQMTVSVEARPQAVPADGVSRIVLFAEVRRGESAAADSTEVILLNTLGTLQQGIIYTRGGIALDTLTSDTVAGNGWIIAYSQGARDSVDVFFTADE
ncbi:MAG: hypothetical protein PHI18_08300 [bacterium]|nr:hypothetical protein [bacterium]